MNEPATSTGEAEILQALKTVIDPELGLNIVELGMVNTAVWRDDNIDVAITPTSPSCPLPQLLVDDAERALRERFPDADAVRIEIVWDPPWSADRLSLEARRKLGLPADNQG